MSPHRYRVVVDGELGPRYAAAFGQMTVFAHDGETDITGTVIDASQLHGLLGRIASLGLTLRSVNRLEPENATSDPEPHRTARGRRPTPTGASRHPPGADEPDHAKPKGERDG